MAPLDLLLSVAESRISEGKPKVQPNGGGIKFQLKEVSTEGIIKKAVVRDGHVYLCKGWKIEDSKDVKLKYTARNLFDALFGGYSPKTSKYAFCFSKIKKSR